MYAKDTSVPVDRSRSEIERILSRYGATSFAYMADSSRAMIAFQAHGKAVKFVLPLPPLKDFVKNAAGASRPTGGALKAQDQACRARWRALALCVKAKLEAVECGITSFEQEFLAHFMLPNGQTFGDHAIPQLEEAAKSGKMPTLALM
jgi:hypothetical protein